MYWYYLIVFFLFGVVIGSFMNVCIFRIPVNQTIVTVPSHCPSCSHRLSWYDLIPIFSYILLRGKCRYCNKGISIQYPFVEILNGLLYILIYIVFGINLLSIIYCIFFSILTILSFIDFKHGIVPDKLNFIIFLLSIPIIILNKQNIVLHIVGFFAVSVPMLLTALLTNGFGGGDIKLYAVSGLIIGWKLALLSVFFMSVSASVYAIYSVLYKNKKLNNTIPLVPFISFGIIVSVLFGNSIISWYLNNFIFL